MKSLHKSTAIPILNEFNEEERGLLCSNKSGLRSSSLDSLDTSSDEISEEEILDYLASILAEVYWYQVHGINSRKKGSDLLPGIDKRAG